MFALDAFGGTKLSGNNHSGTYMQNSKKSPYARNTRKSVTRLPSNTTSAEFGESEERITGTWTPQPEGHLELNPMERKTGFKTRVAGGLDLEHGRDEWPIKEASITKTVQVSQYSA